MADLGDITGFLKEGSVSDLSWLDVDEKAYRELDQLPKQNLDIAPDLEAAWSHTDQPASRFVPNKEGPRTMGDLSEAHGKLAAEKVVPRIVRLARLTMMRDPDPQRLVTALISKYGRDAVRLARDALTALVQERGLLGGYYIEASDFPGCDQGKKEVVEYARRFASNAKFVVACGSCAGCSRNSNNTCGTFHKQIVTEAPYTPELAERVEQTQAARGKCASSPEGLTPRERVKNALLATAIEVKASFETPKPVVNPAQFLRAAETPKKVHLPVFGTEGARIAREEVAWRPVAEGKVASAAVAMDKKALDVVQTLQREMLKGLGEQELVRALKLSFSVDDLQSTRDKWEPLFKEAGLYGSVYSTQDSFDDCREGADFLSRHSSAVKGIVASGRCDGCFYNKMARCLLYGRPLVASADDLYTEGTVKQVIWEQKVAGKIGSEPIEHGADVRSVLKGIYRMASVAGKRVEPMRSHMQAHHGVAPQYVTAGLTKREIQKVASRYLNEGIHGRELLSLLKKRFDPRDLTASMTELKSVLAEQGLQGVYYVDPTTYDDYAKGCDEGSRLHRARLVPYVKMASKCATCVLQTKVGFCSKYNKALVVEPPYTDKLAQQREILAMGNVSVQPVQNLISTPSILAQFEIQAGMNVELNPVPAPFDVDVELGQATVKL
jgi:hypothetical protein